MALRGCCFALLLSSVLALASCFASNGKFSESSVIRYPFWSLARDLDLVLPRIAGILGFLSLSGEVGRDRCLGLETWPCPKSDLESAGVGGLGGGVATTWAQDMRTWAMSSLADVGSKLCRLFKRSPQNVCSNLYVHFNLSNFQLIKGQNKGRNCQNGAAIHFPVDATLRKLTVRKVLCFLSVFAGRGRDEMRKNP